MSHHGRKNVRVRHEEHGRQVAGALARQCGIALTLLLFPIAAVIAEDPTPPGVPAGYIEQQINLLSKARPGWQQIRDSTEFKQWMDHQPPRIQKLRASTSAADAIVLIDLYKKDKAFEKANPGYVDLDAYQRFEEAKAACGFYGESWSCTPVSCESPEQCAQVIGDQLPSSDTLEVYRTLLGNSCRLETVNGQAACVVPDSPCNSAVTCLEGNCGSVPACQTIRAAHQRSTKELAECILDTVLEAENDVVAVAIVASCKEKHPGDLLSKQFPPKSAWGFRSGNECVASKAKSVKSTVAANWIRNACNFLYSGPEEPAAVPSASSKQADNPSASGSAAYEAGRAINRALGPQLGIAFVFGALMLICCSIGYGIYKLGQRFRRPHSRSEPLASTSRAGAPPAPPGAPANNIDPNFCHKCGNKLASRALFCSQCGSAARSSG